MLLIYYLYCHVQDGQCSQSFTCHPVLARKDLSALIWTCLQSRKGTVRKLSLQGLPQTLALC